MKKIILLAVAAIVAVNIPFASATTLSLDNPNLVGNPGDTVGWGFTLTSTPVSTPDGEITPWLVVSDVDFVLDPGVDPVGVFTPFLTLNFQVIGPDTGNGELNPWSQTFDAGLETGIGAYTIDDFQLPGDLATGSIVVTYDEFSVSPNMPDFNPDTDTLATSLDVSAPASVLVADTPEPSSFLLELGAGLCVLLLRRGVRLKPHSTC
jgi:hypothetical protein